MIHAFRDTPQLVAETPHGRVTPTPHEAFEIDHSSIFKAYVREKAVNFAKARHVSFENGPMIDFQIVNEPKLGLPPTVT